MEGNEVTDRKRQRERERERELERQMRLGTRASEEKEIEFHIPGISRKEEGKT